MVQPTTSSMICWFFSIWLEALSYLLCGTAFLDSTDLIEQPISTTYYCTQISCCLSFAYAETRLDELWRESTLEEPLRFEKGEMGKGRVTVWWGGVTVNYFFHSLSNSLTRSVFTEFGRFWPSLIFFEFLTRFCTLYICWLVKSYNYTSQLVILTTLLTILIMLCLVLLFFYCKSLKMCFLKISRADYHPW